MEKFKPMKEEKLQMWIETITSLAPGDEAVHVHTSAHAMASIAYSCKRGAELISWNEGQIVIRDDTSVYVFERADGKFA